MTGAGFGGCAVALVHADAVTNFTVEVARRYKEVSGLDARIYVSPASEGASVILPVGG